MSLQNHLAELRRRHRAVDTEINDLRTHPGVGDAKVHELKRIKLHIKDEIVALERDAEGYRAAA